MKRILIFAILIAAALSLCGELAFADIPRNGLVAEYLFDGTANDTSGNGNNGTVHGAILTSDRFGNANSAYSFNGVSSYIEVPGSTTLDIIDNLTLSAWIDIYQFKDIGGILCYGPDGSDYETYSLDTTGESESKVFFWTNWPSTAVKVYSNPIEKNSWHHVVATFTGGTVKIYVDGALKNSQQISISKLKLGNGRILRFGENQPGGNEFYNGLIDDIRIYNRTLSAPEIIALFNDKKPTIYGFTANPTAGSTPLLVDFTCRAVSPNGAISQYLWDVNGDTFPDQITIVGHLSYTYTSSGTYNTYVTVVDSSGYSVKSDVVKVTIADGVELSGRVENYQFNDVSKAINIQFRVYNTGNIAAGPFYVRFRVSDNGAGSTIFKSVKISGLAVGQNKLVDVSNTFAESIYGRQISIDIDGSRQIAEVDDTNNGARIIISPAVTK